MTCTLPVNCTAMPSLLMGINKHQARLYSLLVLD